MNSKNALYHKSDKGTQAISTRQHGLTPKARSMLILVDGKRGFEELARLSGMHSDAEQLLDQLLADGFIEETAPPAPAPVAAATATAPLVTLSEAQRFAARRLTDLLGPRAEQLCLRIESTRNVVDFHAAVSHAHDIVRDFAGAQKAATFAAEIQAHRPT